MTYSNQGRFVQEFVFFSRRYQGRHFYDAPANKHASRMAATPCPITYVQAFPEQEGFRYVSSDSSPAILFFTRARPMTVHACRTPDPARKKVPRHFVGCKSGVNAAARRFSS